MLVHDVVVSTSCVQEVSGFRFLWMVSGGDEEGSRVFSGFNFFTVCFFWVLVFGKIIFVWCLGAFTVVEDKTKKRKSRKGKNKRKNSREKGKSIMMNRKKKRRKMSKRTSRDSRAGRVEPEKGPNTFTEWNGHFDRGEKAMALETKQQAARNLFGGLRLRRQRRRSASHGARLPSQV